MRPTLPIGAVIANRFEVGPIAGSGGMGTVYRAHDRLSGDRVALKVLHRSVSSNLVIRRFIREAKILSELRHPGIVSYVASGQTDDGLNYLVMEWLEGEDLTHRLGRGALSVPEARELLLRVAAALSCAHQLGVIHRDIKPSNLFLCGGRFDRVVMLDFGVAHREGRTHQSALTQAGAVVGTLAYMAPEQARADVAIGAAADIYSVGRVVYQALSGRFRDAGQHVAAMLARALFEVELPLAQLCPWVPAGLSGLISRMLAKAPEARPADGAALLAELLALQSVVDVPGALVGAPLPAASSEEQRLHSIVLAVPAAVTLQEASDFSGELIRAELETRKVLQAKLTRHGAQVVWLLDGSLLLTLPALVSAHDQAAQAARGALLIKEQWPAATVAVATGRGMLSGQTLIGEVVDRAAALLQAQRALAEAADGAELLGAMPDSIWVDALSASLLERQFALLAVPGGALLSRAFTSSDELRPILGTAAPCIGRDTELTILEAILERCRSESEAEAALITAGAGFGKTRLRQEFVQRALRRPEPPTVLLSVGDVLSAGSPCSLLGQALRRLYGFRPDTDAASARQALKRHCDELLGPMGPRIAPFLGEICGLPFPDVDTPELRVARSDPRSMNVLSVQSFIDFLGALCRRTPVLWVLDDLQWGDFPTVQTVDKALRELDGRPLMILALGRPELLNAFPKVRGWPHVKELPLSPLGRTPSERIARLVLGAGVAAEVVSRIVQQAAGNALLLEELIRAELEHHGEPQPGTVLAILQARMQLLRPRLRLLLGRASILGNRFWHGGLRALLDEKSLAELDADLRELVRAELITMHTDSRLKGEVEYSFRNPLKREAAYGLLMDDQKRRWHRIAGEYLEQAGEQDALALAEHFVRSDEPGRAAPYFARAAALALDGSDPLLARRCIERALEGSPTEPALREELAGLLARTQE